MRQLAAVGRRRVAFGVVVGRLRGEGGDLAVVLQRLAVAVDQLALAAVEGDARSAIWSGGTSLSQYGEPYQSYQPALISSGWPATDSRKPFWSPWLWLNEPYGLDLKYTEVRPGEPRSLCIAAQPMLG